MTRGLYHGNSSGSVERFKQRDSRPGVRALPHARRSGLEGREGEAAAVAVAAAAAVGVRVQLRFLRASAGGGGGKLGYSRAKRPPGRPAVEKLSICGPQGASLFTKCP